MRALVALLASIAALLALIAPKPYADGTLGDLRADALYILNQCPSVGIVERSVAVERPRHRIVHLLDLHPVTRDDFAADIRDQQPDATDDEIEAAYQAAMAEAVRVYLAQDKLLRWLAEFHGVHRVHFEGMTDADRPFKIAEGLFAVPAEDEATYRAADPFQGDRVAFEGPANDAREAAIVRRLLSAGPLAVVVLGAGHDLSQQCETAGDVEYLRVTVQGFPVPEG